MLKIVSTDKMDMMDFTIMIVEVVLKLQWARMRNK